MLTRLLPFIIALAFAPSALAGGPTMQFGAAEDVVRTTDLPAAKAKMTLLRLAGFSSVRVTSQWQGTEATPSETELTVLRNVAGAAQLSAVRVYLSIYPTGSRVTPLTPEARELFAAYVTSLKQQLPSIKDVIIGNEPNINRFWLPQFGPNGSDVAAPTYTALLARSYDAVKLVDPATRVWGGALAPRGIDRPGTGATRTRRLRSSRTWASPTARVDATQPIMDGLAFHPYADTSGQSPDTPHPNSTTIGLADYDRLMRTLATAFDNSPQAGSLLPVLYDEFGVESKIPAGKAAALHRLRAGDDEACRRDHPGRLLREGAPAHVLPAERDGDLRVPHPGRARPRELAVGHLLRGRDAEVEHLRRARCARTRTRRLDRALPGPRPRRGVDEGELSLSGCARGW